MSLSAWPMTSFAELANKWLVVSSTKEVTVWRRDEMVTTVRKRATGFGFEAGPLTLSYRYAVSLNHIVPDEADDRPHACRSLIFDTGSYRMYRVVRVGSFYEITFGKPGDPTPTVELTDIECPNPQSFIDQLMN
jgi:hypothetical protein